MTVRAFVISAALMIFCWLTATFLRTVPMETYPANPSMSAVIVEDSAPPVLATSTEKAGARLVSGTSARQ